MDAEIRTDVLIVEDSPTQALALRVSLQQRGFSVTVVSDGAEALMFLARERPRLVISDIVLSNIDGFELCRRIRADAALGDVGVVLWTQMGAPANLPRGLEAGALAVVRKSLDDQDVLALLQGLLPRGADRADAAAGGYLLVVEDSPTQASLLTEALRVLGCETQTTPDGRAALEAARRRRPEVIISDIRMPLMDGFELCRAVKSDPELQSVPVILLTALSSPRDVLSALEAGADFFIPKPYQGGYLVSRIREILSRSGEESHVERAAPETITFDGEAYRISATREHILRLLLSTYEVARQNNQALTETKAELAELNTSLERKVDERTSALVAEMGNRKIVEDRESLAREVLDLLNHPGETKAGETIRAILALIRERTGIEAAGIRLREGEDYPYFATEGFPQAFVRRESRLLARNPDGTIIRDVAGLALPECMCGTVISGLTDPAQPFFTQAGSFWTNSTTELLAATSASDRQGTTRNYCNASGYESVALIPLRASGEIAGLLQLNDKRRGRFTPETIGFYETLGGSIGIAVARMRAFQRIEDLARFPTENPNPVLRVGIDGLLQYANPASHKLLQSWGIGIGSPLPPDWQKLVGQATAGGATVRANASRDGVTFSVTAAPVVGSGYVNLYAEDVTERLLLEASLRQSQKLEAIGTLAGGVAHDFNNMLAVIMGYTEQALKKLSAGHPAGQPLVAVKDAAQRSANLVRQLLAFARKQAIEPKLLDVNDTISAMLTMLRRLIGENIELVWNPGQDLAPVYVDPSQIDQLLTNLLVNARDAMTGAGRIVVETSHAEFDEEYCARREGFTPGLYLELAVSDDGSGMDKATLARLFEPFFTTKPTGKGTGLGLATVYGIVKQNGGFINVYTEPKVGTTFRIYLPRQLRAEINPGQTPQSVVPTSGTETVLLVEDETALLELCTMMLEELGYSVLAAGNPGDAVKLVAEHRGEIHLLMTDVMLPGMSGRELEERIRAVQPNVKCLFMSGYTADVIGRRGVLDKNVHFVAKPFTSEALAVKLREALSR